MSAHATLSPSGAHRWMACPGSIREEAKYPEKTSKYAIDGTHSHTLLEYCLKEGITDASELLTVTLSDDDGEFTIKQDRADRVNVALDYIDKIKHESLVSVRSEEKVHPGGWLGRDDMWGTCDIQIIGQEIYEVVDYKDGWTPVSPNDPQLKLYAVGGLLNYTYEDGSYPFKTIRTTIIQPNLGTEPFSVDHSIDELVSWMRTTVYSAANATDADDAPLIGGSHCKWCRVSGNCKAQAEHNLMTAQVLFENVANIEMAQQSADVDPNELSDDKIREILEAAPVIKEFLNAVNDAALNRFETGKPIAGLKMVYSGKGRASWKEGVDVEKTLRGMKVPKAEIYHSKLITPAEAKKLKWKNRAKKMVTLTDRQIDKLNNDLIQSSKGGKMIVPESDDREAIITDAATLFEDVSTLPDWMQTPDWLKPQE